MTSRTNIDIAPGQHIDPGCNYVHSDQIGVCTKCGWTVRGTVRVTVSGITRSAGISSLHRDIPMGDWTLDMILVLPEVAALIERYRAQDATEMRVTFEIKL